MRCGTGLQPVAAIESLNRAIGRQLIQMPVRGSIIPHLSTLTASSRARL